MKQTDALVVGLLIIVGIVIPVHRTVEVDHRLPTH